MDGSRAISTEGFITVAVDSPRNSVHREFRRIPLRIQTIIFGSILTCQLAILLPIWLPRQEPELARFVNEIVLGEESDENGRGSFRSHFELYLDSMDDVQANRAQIVQFIQSLREGVAVADALKFVTAPANVQNFVNFTHQVTTTSSAAEVACVFCFGREDIIPEMFQRLLTSFEETEMPVPSLSYYIRRHIELDGDHHGPLARRMVNLLCIDSQTTEQCVSTTRTAIQQRIQLWDGVLAEIDATIR